jgi:hypothetical protein
MTLHWGVSSMKRASGSTRAIALILSVAAGSAATLSAANAAVFYKTSGDLVLSIGDQIDSLFDKISLGPYASTFVAPELKDLNPLTFVVSKNTNTTAPYTTDGDLTEAITVGGAMKTVSIPFVATIDSDSAIGADSLSVPSATFVVGGYQFVTVPLTFVNVAPDLPNPDTQFLQATISADPISPSSGVPEPGAWVLMLAGVGVVGLWRRAGFALRQPIKA